MQSFVLIPIISHTEGNWYYKLFLTTHGSENALSEAQSVRLWSRVVWLVTFSISR